MAKNDSIQDGSYELPLREESTATGQGERTVTGDSGRSLPESLLIRNVLWFCRIRWIIIAILMGYGILGRFDDVLRRIGLCSPGSWPLIAACILTAGNALFLTHSRLLLTSPSRRNSTMINIWSQIIMDLCVLTAVVHFFGSVRTYVPFMYLFHIVLACVFFSRRQSLAVMVIASVMFAACLAGEHLEIVAPVSVFVDPAFEMPAPTKPAALALRYLSATGIWLVVWYLASYLSMMVRARDNELAEINRRLWAAQEERSRHMLTTTHQLKAPFAAIHANTQLLLKGYCGQLPDEATKIAQRIAARCRRLAAEIQEMLQLANLSSIGQQPPVKTRIDLRQLLRSCIAQVQPMAQERSIVFDENFIPVPAVGIEDHLKMLFLNLLYNAVAYSHEGGHVRVRCGINREARPVVTVADDGIGILPEKLPRIFEEHYRTKEAVRHNKESSGMGLAIVRQVAENHQIHLRVESQPGAGTTFELTFPSIENISDEPRLKETQ